MNISNGSHLCVIFFSRLCHICYATLYDRVLLYVNFTLDFSLTKQTRRGKAERI